jgi:2-desacetyl-2-hydroxyethyl bacteriochlorophyllide A dehydrogenase
MRAAVFEGAGRVAVQNRPDPVLARPDEVIIQVAVNGLCGSDLRAFATPPEMVYDEGVVVGHEFSGTVVAAGHEATLAIGNRVIVHPNIWCQTCEQCRSGRTNLCDRFVHIGSMRDGGAAELCVVPERMVYRVPDSLPFSLAALAEPLACVLNGTTRARVHPGEAVLVLGGGPIGLLYVMLIAAAGASPVLVSEPSPTRAAWARDLGADVVIDPSSQDVAAEVLAATNGIGVDVAIDSVGSLLPQAIDSVRKGGRIYVFGLNERAEVMIRPAQLAYREVAIEGVYIAKGTFPLALRMLEENALGFDRLVTHEIPLEQFADAVELLRSGEALKALVVP